MELSCRLLRVIDFSHRNIPLSAICTESWRPQLFCNDNDLEEIHRRTVEGVYADFIKTAIAGLNLFLKFKALGDELTVNLFLYHTKSEI